MASLRRVKDGGIAVVVADAGGGGVGDCDSGGWSMVGVDVVVSTSWLASFALRRNRRKGNE